MFRTYVLSPVDLSVGREGRRRRGGVIKSQCRGILDSGTYPVSFVKINIEEKNNAKASRLEESR